MPLYHAAPTPQLYSYFSPPYQTGAGAYYWAHLAPATTGKPNDGNGQIVATPWIVPNAITLTQIGIDVTSVTGVDAGGILRFAIFNESGNWLPGSLLRELGTIAGDATSVTNPTFTSAFSLSLQPGLYWIAMACQGMATARPTTGVIAAASVLWGSYTTTNSSRAIPLINGALRTCFNWSPSTSPAFNLVTTTFSAVSQWTTVPGTVSGPWPRFAIKIA